MKGSLLALAFTAIAALALTAGHTEAQSKKKPAASSDSKKIDVIMKKAFKKGTLLDKIKQHDATKAEMQQFADYCKALIDLKPPKGDLKSWKDRTTLLYQHAGAVAKGDESKFNALFDAATCKDCHNAHKDD